MHKIKTETEYHQALQRIESLWGSPPGSFYGKKLDRLIDLVLEWEKKEYPIDPPTYQQAVNFRREQERS